MLDWLRKLLNKSSFEKLRKKNIMHKTKRPRFTKEQLCNTAFKKWTLSFATHPDKEFWGPAETSKEKYWQYYLYFCAMLQRELLKGNVVTLPGIGSLWLTIKKEHKCYNNILKAKLNNPDLIIPAQLRLKARTADRLEDALNLFTWKEPENDNLGRADSNISTTDNETSGFDK